MIKYQQHILNANDQARQALRVLENLSDGLSRTLFIVDESGKLIGSLTDGDIRRGLLKELEISGAVSEFMNKSCQYIKEKENSVEKIKSLRQNKVEMIPMVDDQGKIVQILDLKETVTLLPAAALIMAGGRGERLRPFTDKTPKPMLFVGSKPIIEHNIDRLIQYGVSEIFISVGYLKEQIWEYFGDGSSKGIKIKYVTEDAPLGTIGALSLIEDISYDHLIVMNSDILTNVDFEDFFKFYQDNEADMVVASIPYIVNVPYAVLDTDHHKVVSFIEKPTYTYYSNGGMYIMKTALKNILVQNEFFNATDLMNVVIDKEGHKLVHYPLVCYWLDIGKHQDYIKAQEDIKHLII